MAEWAASDRSNSSSSVLWLTGKQLRTVMCACIYNTHVSPLRELFNSVVGVLHKIADLQTKLTPPLTKETKKHRPVLEQKPNLNLHNSEFFFTLRILIYIIIYIYIQAEMHMYRAQVS